MLATLAPSSYLAVLKMQVGEVWMCVFLPIIGLFVLSYLATNPPSPPQPSKSFFMSHLDFSLSFNVADTTLLCKLMENEVCS